MSDAEEAVHGNGRAGDGASPSGGGCAGGSCGCSEGAPEAAGERGPSRRDFLKVLGVTGAGAATFGCAPDLGDRLIPYLIQHEEGTPGVSRTYATALAEQGPEPLGVHAQVRDGRVVKLEGNPEIPTNRGRLSALAQSALQDLYDPDRVRNPLRRRGDAPAAGSDTAAAASAAAEDEGSDAGPPAGFEDATWEDALAEAGRAVAGGGAVLLTGAPTGATARFFGEWAAATGAEHVPLETFHYEPVREAHREVFGQAVIPSYELHLADHIVCFGADFLGAWLAPVELATRFAEARDVDGGRFAKLTYVGPRLPLTGTNADEWLESRPGTEGLVAEAVAGLLGAGGGAGVEEASRASGVPAERIRALADELRSASAPVAVPPGFAEQGPDATERHVAVARLNRALGAVGSRVRLDGGPLRGRAAPAAVVRDLVARMRDGSVRTLVVTASNPVFALPRSLGFREALAEVETVVAIGPHLDETAAAADVVLPAHHALESWGDVEIRAGVRALSQPVMRPLWDTRGREDILMGIAAAAGSGADFGAATFADYLQNVWREEVAPGGADFSTFWREALRRGGVFDRPAATSAGAAEGAAASGAAAGGAAAGAAAPQAAGAAGASDTAAGAAGAPDTAARAEAGAEAPAQDEAAAGDVHLVVYPTVQFFDGRGANRSWMQELPDPVTKNVWSSWVEVHPEMAERLGVEHGDVLRVESEAGAVEAPVHVWHGVHREAVAIPIGQGHTAYGRYARGRGVNPLDLLPARFDERSGALAFAGTRVRVTATGARERLANTQGSDADYGREVAEIRELAHVQEALAAHSVMVDAPVDAAWDSDPESPYRWGMSIDVNACTGCGACVTACYAENNIPTVGEDEVARGREMSWLRVERYYQALDEEGAYATVHLPMLCQHCGDAPCEPVCPVYATYHNPEGLNAQVYNRCVGTRYCSNNCPYKVRRFNWFTYDFPYPLNLQLNPDVTVREKGVMEKCTFCVQRINRKKIEAKDENRLVRDGEIVTACQQTCPADAIVFGNLKDPGSRVSRHHKSARAYHVLAELGTRPAIGYLEGVTHAALAEEGHGADPGGLEEPLHEPEHAPAGDAGGAG